MRPESEAIRGKGSSPAGIPIWRSRRLAGGRLLRLCLKELREILRDRRTIVTLVLMPLLVYPLLSLGFQRLLLTSLGAGSEPSCVIAVNAEAEVARVQQFLTVGEVLLRQTQPPASPAKKGWRQARQTGVADANAGAPHSMGRRHELGTGGDSGRGRPGDPCPAGSFPAGRRQPPAPPALRTGFPRRITRQPDGTGLRPGPAASSRRALRARAIQPGGTRAALSHSGRAAGAYAVPAQLSR